MISLRFKAGEVICLRRGLARMRASTYGQGLIELKEATSFPDADGLTIEQYHVSQGEELAWIGRLARQSDVVVSSLNYVGSLQAQVKSLMAGANNTSRLTWLLADENGKTSKEITRNELQNINKPVVAAVDVLQSHCNDVIRAIQGGSKFDTGLAIIGLTLVNATANLVDLYQYSKLLLSLTDLNNDILAVNMSVDFGETCAGSLEVSLPNQLTPMMYSFPFFEVVLDSVSNGLQSKSKRLLCFDKKDEYTTIAYFTAAGNRKGPLRMRLGYPAILPQTTAVTFISKTDSEKYSIHSSADLPMIYDLKPCLAIDADEALAVHCPVNGTSFASAWMSGVYAWHAMQLGKIAQGKRLKTIGQVAKMSFLLSHSEVKNLESTKYKPMLSRVHLYSEHTTSERLEASKLTELLALLNREFPGAEFCATGSMAMLSEWLNVNNKSIDSLGKALDQLGDLDLGYRGSIDASDNDNVRVLVCKWFSENTNYSREWKNLKVDLHPLFGRTSFALLSQCRVPASTIILTEVGPIDVWDGVEDLRDNNLSLYILEDKSIWLLNPQYLTGSNGIAMGILIWLSSLNLLSLCAISIGNTPPKACVNSLNLSRYYVDQGLNNDTEALQLLFGFAPTLESQRFEDRFKRVKGLIKATNREENELTKLFDDLLTCYEKYTVLF